MLVKYIGHGDMISSDWNGKRYVFSKRNPIIEIPEGLYDNIKSSNFVLKNAIVFCEREDNVPAWLRKAIDPVVKHVTPSVEQDVEPEVKKRPGRPKKTGG
jgi:hypothetical protein